jgi:hypothetical protein
MVPRSSARGVLCHIRTRPWKVPEAGLEAPPGPGWRDLDDLATEPPRGGAVQITPAMRAVRAAPLPVRRAVYERWRIEEELEWYRAKSAWNQRRAHQLTLAAISREHTLWRAKRGLPDRRGEKGPG